MFKKVVLTVSLVFILSSITSLLFAVPADKTLSWAGGSQGQVTFEGDEHAEKAYACDSCHPSLFQMRKGSAKITFASHTNGQFCGACHNGTTAFGTDNPQKCHKCHKKERQEYRKQHRHRHHE